MNTTATDSSSTAAASASASAAAQLQAQAQAQAQATEEDRLQGERFLQLSQRCHEQNWAQVHALAEQIVLHKQRCLSLPPSNNNEGKSDSDSAEGPTTGGGSGHAAAAVSREGSTTGGGGEGALPPTRGTTDRLLQTTDGVITNTTPNNMMMMNRRASSRRASREGTVSISGEVMSVDSIHSLDLLDEDVDAANNITEGAINSGGNGEEGNSSGNGGEANGGVASTNTSSSRNDNTTNNNAPQPPPPAAPTRSPAPLHHHHHHHHHPPSTPRMLSTCLGTASPLAWTCRYSAPSSTVKLVLDLDLSAVRRCLPQLGTPLHECVGRPRPLRKMPLKRGRWNVLVENGALQHQQQQQNQGQGGASTANTTTDPSSSSNTAAATAGAVNGTKKKKKKKKGSKKKKKQQQQQQRSTTPRILAGLREWRRTVRTLIQADETLLKEDARVAALQAKEAAMLAAAANNNNNGGCEGSGNGGEGDKEEWRSAVQDMIKDNVTNIQKFKEATTSPNNNATTASTTTTTTTSTPVQQERRASAPQQERRSSSNGGSSSGGGILKSSMKSPAQKVGDNGRPIRAALAQDADGNTPLHFMIRGAAAPAFGGGRWQARHEVEMEDEYDDDEEEEEESSDDDEEEEKEGEKEGEKKGGKGEGEGGNEMDVDSTAGESSGNAAGAAGNATAVSNNANNNPAAGGGGNNRDLRHIEYWGTSGSSWDGVRWCMEAHLRRVERRMARQLRWKEERMEKAKAAEAKAKSEEEEEEEGVGSGGEDDDEDDADTSDQGWSDGERRVANFRIGSPRHTATTTTGGSHDEDMPDATTSTSEDDSKLSLSHHNGSNRKRQAKRKSFEFRQMSDEGSVKSSRMGSATASTSSSLLSSSKAAAKSASATAAKGGAKGGGKNNTTTTNKRSKSSRRKKKYLDNDEQQDCCYDPLLGAVRDLVHSCPEAAGIPDHREYEETPLIVALKSSIYVVLEPDNDFQLVERIPAAAAAAAAAVGAGEGNVAGGIAMLQQQQGGGQGGRAVGDGFALFGGGVLNGAGVGGVPGAAGVGGGGGGLGIVGGGGGLGIGGGFGGGAFPFPELGALMHNRPFNMFPDDEAMMAVLRGHGRRVTRDYNRRRSSTASVPTPRGSFIKAGDVTDVDAAGDATNATTDDNIDDDSSACSSVSDSSSFTGEDDPRQDAFVPTANEHIFSFGVQEPPGVQLGLLPRRRPRYDYQTALEYRIFCLVRIMLDAYPRAACLMISDYTPLHSAVFHGRCPDTIRLLLDAEARFRSGNDCGGSDETKTAAAGHPAPSTAAAMAYQRIQQGNTPEPCPTLSGPAMLCTNTRGELPLHFACMRNECARSIRLLAEADPRAALVRDASGRTPLRWLWIRFVDGLLDRFGGRDTQGHHQDHNQFQEQEGGRNTPNFPNPGQSVLGGMARGNGGGARGGLSVGNGAFDSSFNESGDDNVGKQSAESMFVFDTEYLRRTRNIDRTVDFLRMRHVPSGFENIEYVAAEHAITVLLKLKYLQQRRNRQLEAAEGTNGRALPPDVPMSTKEEFILYAFEKFTALIYAALVASEAEAEEQKMASAKAASTASEKSMSQSDDFFDEGKMDADDVNTCGSPSRKKLWHFLPRVNTTSKQFFLVHEACRSSRASCPAAVAKICIRLFSDQLFQRDDEGQLPLHKVACRGLGWEPPGSDMDTAHASLADETLTLLKEVLSGSHDQASETFDNHRQLPLHCAVDSLVTSLVMGKKRRASLHAEARVALQKYRHTHVEIAMQCLGELLHANSSALQCRDGKTGLFPFMQAAVPHVHDQAVVKYTSDLSRRPGFDVGVGFHSMERDVVEENDVEAESDHITIIYYLLREDPSVINGLC